MCAGPCFVVRRSYDAIRWNGVTTMTSTTSEQYMTTRACVRCPTKEETTKKHKSCMTQRGRTTQSDHYYILKISEHITAVCLWVFVFGCVAYMCIYIHAYIYSDQWRSQRTLVVRNPISFRRLNTYNTCRNVEQLTMCINDRICARLFCGCCLLADIDDVGAEWYAIAVCLIYLCT